MGGNDKYLTFKLFILYFVFLKHGYRRTTPLGSLTSDSFRVANCSPPTLTFIGQPAAS